MTSKHKVFISYYHKDDQRHKDLLLSINSTYNIFDDYSVHEDEIDDTGLTDEQIRRRIRDEYIRDSTVLILLCGKNSKRRKHIDWEIHAAMYDSEVNPKMGIIVVNLPGSENSQHACDEEERKMIASGAKQSSCNSRVDYECSYPSVPSRLIDNFVKEGVKISVVDWDMINCSPEVMTSLIDKAFSRRKTNAYDDSAPLRHNNS